MQHKKIIKKWWKKAVKIIITQRKINENTALNLAFAATRRNVKLKVKTKKEEGVKAVNTGGAEQLAYLNLAH